MTTPATASSAFDLVRLVCTSLGRFDDETQQLVYRSLNWSILTAAILFKPRELNTLISAVIPAGALSIDLSSIMADPWLTIDGVIDTTNNKIVGLIPYDAWHRIVPSNAPMQYYTLYGTLLYVNKAPVVDTILSVAFRKYPRILATGLDVVDFIGYDAFITSTTISVAQAMYEEGDASEVMRKIVGDSLAPAQLSTADRQQLERQIAGGLPSADKSR